MKTPTCRVLISLFLLGAGLGAGCGGDDAGPGQPQAGDAFLTVVGATSVFLENGWQQAITVRYHDGDDHALAGAVGFAVHGPAAGAALSSALAVTDGDGTATVTLAAGPTGEAAFTVEASAPLADPVRWRVAVHHAEPTGPLDPTGRYLVSSELDLVSGLPGTLGQVTRTFLDMTDSPHDPATWLLDQAVASIGDVTTRNLVNATRPALDAVVNEALRAASPALVPDLLAVSRDLGLVARRFGTRSMLAVAAAGTGFTSTHTLTHVVLALDGRTVQVPLAELGMASQVASRVSFAMTDDRAEVGAHRFPLSYGSVLMVALDEVVLPRLDPAATDLASFFARRVDCDAVGRAIATHVGLGSPALYRGACQVGVGAAASYLTTRVRGLDGTALVIELAGRARPLDTNTDRAIDRLHDGAWTGTMTYGTAPVTLGPSTFRGDRLAN